ncbi:hypothetical protein ACFX2I_013127 [Malus domestica]
MSTWIKFCRDCCCILCCKSVNSSCAGYDYIRCEALKHDGSICGHAAHIDCALQCYMAGTVRGSIGLDSEYYCRGCDEKTDLGSQKTSARDLLKRIEVAIEKVSLIRANKSNDKRLSIFTGTKTLHLWCVTREDRATWIEALLGAKDLFPRVFTSNDLVPSEDIVVSTEKLRLRLAQEGIGEPVIKDCESIMLLEVSELQNQMKGLQRKHVMLLESLRQLETEKIELETTVVDETKERESYRQGNGRFSDALSSASYCIFERDSFFSDRLHGVEEIKTIK